MHQLETRIKGRPFTLSTVTAGLSLLFIAVLRPARSAACRSASRATQDDANDRTHGNARLSAVRDEEPRRNEMDMVARCSQSMWARPTF